MRTKLLQSPIPLLIHQFYKNVYQILLTLIKFARSLNQLKMISIHIRFRSIFIEIIADCLHCHTTKNHVKFGCGFLKILCIPTANNMRSGFILFSHVFFPQPILKNSYIANSM